MNRQRITLDGVAFDAITRQDVVERIADGLASGHGGLAVTSNLDHLRRARTDPHWRNLLAQAELVVADGTPVLWAARLQRTPLPERLAGSDLVWPLCASAAARGHGVYLLGGAPGTAERAARILADRYPGLRLAGWSSPTVDAAGQADDEAGLRAQLLAAQPGLVLIGLGSPKQELLAIRLRADLPRTWFVGVGVTFSFVCGEVRRAPRWMQRAGLEWLHRLAQEPRRLASRYLLLGLPYAARLFLGCLRRRFSRAR